MPVPSSCKTIWTLLLANNGDFERQVLHICPPTPGLGYSISYKSKVGALQRKERTLNTFSAPKNSLTTRVFGPITVDSCPLR